jgi:cytochrome c-type biogenesis protein CcmH/NrfG
MSRRPSFPRAVVAGFVGALSSFLTQRYPLVKKAQIVAFAMERKALPDYQALAWQRLLESIGPLRMQLLFSALPVRFAR